MKDLIKWPLLISAILVVSRVALERAGAPDMLNNVLSVVIFYLFVAPLYFAYRIAKSDRPKPYRSLLGATALHTALARAIVIPTYWLAYKYQWQQPRFSLENGGNVGRDVTPLMGYAGIPLAAAVAWVILSLIVGGALGSIVIKVMRKHAVEEAR